MCVIHPARVFDLIEIHPQSHGTNVGSSTLTGAMDEMGVSGRADHVKVGTPFASSSSQTPWTSGTPNHREIGTHPFLQDATGLAPRPQSAAPTRANTMFQPTSSRNDSGYMGHSSRSSLMSPPYVPPYPAASSDVMSIRQGSHMTQPQSLSPRSFQQMEQEINMLRRKVKELEFTEEQSRIRTQELERALASGSGSMIPSISQGPPTSQPTRTPFPPSVQGSWKARTAARVRLFCSLNRAGNALCAWHDSRRERRAYPPRMAPAGYLNCGCQYEEALFEESLARHGVGSYHPGENVRMDPALRNPLLRLLQKRYGYVDGDFERDPETGEWLDGEGHVQWEQKLAHGALSARKNRGEDRR